MGSGDNLSRSQRFRLDPLRHFRRILPPACDFRRPRPPITPGRGALTQRSATHHESSTSRDSSRAMSFAGSTSSTQPLFFHAGTGVWHWSFGTKRDRSTSW